jgi:integrase
MENIQKRLGHPSLTTTEKIYARHDDSQKAETLKTIEVT